MLVLINKVNKFYNNFSFNDINTYEKYTKVVDAFIDEFNKDKVKKECLDYKSFDRYIWTWAKEILYSLNRHKK